MTEDKSRTSGKFALIGAGPMGLAMAKALVERGIAFEGFELSKGVGGLWDIDAPHSTMYKTAHLISSKKMTEFNDFPMEERVAEYPSHREMKKYFNAFAEHFDLKRHYRFETEVIAAEPLEPLGGGGWRVKWRGADGSEGEGTFRGLLVANGTLSEPNRPSFKGHFDGELIHACDYKDPEQFRGKRVLIVGAGNSGCDIAVDAIAHGVKADISMRRGYHFVPKYVFGKPADTVGAMPLPRFIKKRLDPMILKWFIGDPQRYGFPKPDHALYESHPIVNSLVLFHAGHGDIGVKPDIDRLDGHTVHFKDGSHEDYDMIVAATGYLLHYPFLDRSLLNWKGDAPHLYLNCFHPDRDDLFLLGMVEAKGLGWQGRQEQADLVAQFIVGGDRDTAAAKAFRKTKREPFDEMKGGMNYIKLARMAYYVDKDTYRKTIARHSKAFAAEGIA